MTRHGRQKNSGVKHFTCEIGEKISFPLDIIREYPKKNVFAVGESIYYVYKLFDRMVIERVIFEEGQV